MKNHASHPYFSKLKTGFVLLCFVVLNLSVVQAQNDSTKDTKLDVSLFWKKTGESINFVEDAKGDLFSKLGHHGPAIENLWLAYRVYFNESGAIDILSKFQARLELKTSKWYPKKNKCSPDYGTDNYDVGSSLGLGGINLYDPATGLQKLGPVTKRSAEVILTDSTAQIKMIAYGIPYKNLVVDLEFTLTTKINERHATIKVRELSGQTVQFAAGVSTNSKLQITRGENYFITWGDYNSHARYADFNIGAALLYNPADFEAINPSDLQELFISKPCNSLTYSISACNDQEQSALTNVESFESYIQELSKMLNTQK